MTQQRNPMLLHKSKWQVVCQMKAAKRLKTQRKIKTHSYTASLQADSILKTFMMMFEFLNTVIKIIVTFCHRLLQELLKLANYEARILNFLLKTRLRSRRDKKTPTSRRRKGTKTRCKSSRRNTGKFKRPQALEQGRKHGHSRHSTIRSTQTQQTQTSFVYMPTRTTGDLKRSPTRTSKQQWTQATSSTIHCSLKTKNQKIIIYLTVTKSKISKSLLTSFNISNRSTKPKTISRKSDRWERSKQKETIDPWILLKSKLPTKPEDSRQAGAGVDWIGTKRLFSRLRARS